MSLDEGNPPGYHMMYKCCIVSACTCVERHNVNHDLTTHAGCACLNCLVHVQPMRKLKVAGAFV